MILSHRHKLIFLKPRKVAGTSFEIALCKYCGPDDIITPIHPDCEKLRTEFGFRGSQNIQGSRSVRFSRRLVKALGLAPAMGQPHRLFYNHMLARQVRNRVGQSIWDSYTKISIARNPYDLILSSYFWSLKTDSFDPEKFRTFFLNGSSKLLSNRQITHIGSKDVVDHWIRFECLEEDILALEQRVPALRGLSGVMSSVRAKPTAYKRNGQSLADIYDQIPEIAFAISVLLRRELEQFGYPVLANWVSNPLAAE